MSYVTSYVRSYVTSGGCRRLEVMLACARAVWQLWSWQRDRVTAQCHETGEWSGPHRSRSHRPQPRQAGPGTAALHGSSGQQLCLDTSPAPTTPGHVPRAHQLAGASSRVSSSGPGPGSRWPVSTAASSGAAVSWSVLAAVTTIIITVDSSASVQWQQLVYKTFTSLVTLSTTIRYLPYLPISRLLEIAIIHL